MDSNRDLLGLGSLLIVMECISLCQQLEESCALLISTQPTTDYLTCELDIRDYISLEEIMEELDLGLMED